MTNLFVKAGGIALPLLLFFVNPFSTNAQDDSIYRLAAGTRVKLRMSSNVGSKYSGVGDTFTARVDEPITKRDIVVMPKGIEFEGRVTTLSRAGNAGRAGSFSILIDKIIVGSDTRRTVSAKTLTAFKGGSARKTSTLGIIGGTAVGALVGFFTGSRNGPLIGAGVGAGVGTGAALSKRGNDIELKEGEVFEIELTSDLIMPVLDN